MSASRPAASSPPAAPSAPTDAALAELSHGLASVLPFLYVAWADGLLAPTQVAQIRARVAAQDWLTDADRAQLERWLDPAAPPSATDYYRWVRIIKRAVADLPAEARGSLADVGVELARLSGAGASPEARQALAEMEATLGVVGRELVADLVERRSGGDGAAGAPPEPAAPAIPPGFDVEAMRRVLDGERAPVRERVRALLRDPAFAYPDPELPKDAYRDLVLERLRLIARQGLGALPFPDYAGGTGDIGAFIAAFETIAYGDLSLLVKYGVQFGLFGGAINQLGTDRHRRAYLPDVASAALPGCFAMSERAHGSNVRELETTATFDPEADAFVVHTPAEADHKEWIGNAARHGRLAVVFAQLVIGEEHYGVHAFLVPLRDEAGAVLPGVRIEDSGYKMGLNGVDNGRIWFDRVRIPRENLLDRFAQVAPDGTYTSPIPSSSKRFFTMLGTLVGGRIAVGSGAVSAAKSALTIAVRYGARRRQFGPADGHEVAILDYLSHLRRLLPPVAAAYGLTFALHELAERFAATAPGADVREIEAHAAALKAYASAGATDAIQTAREACGGEGYRWANRIPALKADADIFTTFEGDNTVLLLQVAKSLLSGYQQEFADLNFFGLLGKLRERAEVRLGEPNPLVRRQADRAHLRSADLHADLLLRRERDLLISAARRLKGRMDRGEDSFEAFVEVQDHLLALARAHAERLVHDAFRRGIEATADDHLRGLLEKVAALFALHAVEADAGWFLQQHYIEAGKAEAIRAEVNALLVELRPVAVDLVDAFGIPDEVLAAPIATGA